MYQLENKSHDEFTVDRPIRGKIQRNGRSRGKPATAAEFLQAVDNFLTIPGIYGLRWEQFTPVFNDGDPCVFSVYEVRVRLSPLDDGSDERGEYEDGWIDSWSLSYLDEDEKPSPITMEAVKVAGELWDELNLDEVAQRNFGDHAQVTATTEGFSVEHYDHD